MLILRPLDQIAARYGDALRRLSTEQGDRIMGRALNYEGQRVFNSVKRALRAQTSIKMPAITKATRTIKASTKGGALEFKIVARGNEMKLREFAPRQFRPGVKATVWGKKQTLKSTFMGPRPGTTAIALRGHVFVRTGEKRRRSSRTGKLFSPIRLVYGPSIPKEIVKDEAMAAFHAGLPRVVERVGIEIATVLRGY
jgi:hypothetical protein